MRWAAGKEVMSLEGRRVSSVQSMNTGRAGGLNSTQSNDRAQTILRPIEEVNMNRNRLAVGFAIGLVMAAVAIGRANDGARGRPTKEFLIEGTLSGSSLTTEIDTNGDGLRPA